MSPVYTELLDRIASAAPAVGEIGLGCVGLPLAVEADWADLVADARNAVKRRAARVLRLGAPAPIVAPDSAAEVAVE